MSSLKLNYYHTMIPNSPRRRRTENYNLKKDKLIASAKSN
ncbi:hypothetical protein AAZX31_13G312900 [Glycine max]